VLLVVTIHTPLDITSAKHVNFGCVDTSKSYLIMLIFQNIRCLNLGRKICQYIYEYNIFTNTRKSHFIIPTFRKFREYTNCSMWFYFIDTRKSYFQLINCYAYISMFTISPYREGYNSELRLLLLHTFIFVLYLKGFPSVLTSESI
jgi:hypothetical protein